MADEQKKAAQHRLFRVCASIQKSEGVTLDGSDPKFRALCDSPELVTMTDDEMRTRALELIRLATDFPC
jgi:fumarate hydratase class II